MSDEDKIESGEKKEKNIKSHLKTMQSGIVNDFLSLFAQFQKQKSAELSHISTQSDLLDAFQEYLKKNNKGSIWKKVEGLVRKSLKKGSKYTVTMKDMLNFIENREVGSSTAGQEMNVFIKQIRNETNQKVVFVTRRDKLLSTLDGSEKELFRKFLDTTSRYTPFPEGKIDEVLKMKTRNKKILDTCYLAFYDFLHHSAQGKEIYNKDPDRSKQLIEKIGGVTVKTKTLLHVLDDLKVKGKVKGSETVRGLGNKQKDLQTVLGGETGGVFLENKKKKDALEEQVLENIGDESEVLEAMLSAKSESLYDEEKYIQEEEKKLADIFGQKKFGSTVLSEYPYTLYLQEIFGDKWKKVLEENTVDLSYHYLPRCVKKAKEAGNTSFAETLEIYHQHKDNLSAMPYIGKQKLLKLLAKETLDERNLVEGFYGGLLREYPELKVQYVNFWNKIYSLDKGDSVVIIPGTTKKLTLKKKFSFLKNSIESEDDLLTNIRFSVSVDMGGIDKDLSSAMKLLAMTSDETYVINKIDKEIEVFNKNTEYCVKNMHGEYLIEVNGKKSYRTKIDIEKFGLKDFLVKGYVGTTASSTEKDLGNSFDHTLGLYEVSYDKRAEYREKESGNALGFSALHTAYGVDFVLEQMTEGDIQGSDFEEVENIVERRMKTTSNGKDETGLNVISNDIGVFQQLAMIGMYDEKTGILKTGNTEVGLEEGKDVRDSTARNTVVDEFNYQGDVVGLTDEQEEYFYSDFSNFADFYKDIDTKTLSDEQKVLLENLKNRDEEMKKENGFGLPAWIRKGNIYYNSEYFLKKYGIHTKENTEGKGNEFSRDGEHWFSYKELYAEMCTLEERENEEKRYEELKSQEKIPGLTSDEKKEFERLKNKKNTEGLRSLSPEEKKKLKNMRGIREDMKRFKRHEVMHRVLQVQGFRYEDHENKKTWDKEKDRVNGLQGDVLEVVATQKKDEGDDIASSVFLTHEVLTELAEGGGDDELHKSVNWKIKPYVIESWNKKTGEIILVGVTGSPHAGKKFILQQAVLEKTLGLALFNKDVVKNENTGVDENVFSFGKLSIIDAQLLDDYAENDTLMEGLLASASSVKTTSSVTQAIVDANPDNIYVVDSADVRLSGGVAPSGENVIAVDFSAATTPGAIDALMDTVSQQISAANPAGNVLLPHSPNLPGPEGGPSGAFGVGESLRTAHPQAYERLQERFGQLGNQAPVDNPPQPGAPEESESAENIEQVLELWYSKLGGDANAKWQDGTTIFVDLGAGGFEGEGNMYMKFQVHLNAEGVRLVGETTTEGMPDQIGAMNISLETKEDIESFNERFSNILRFPKNTGQAYFAGFLANKSHLQGKMSRDMPYSWTQGTIQSEGGVMKKRDGKGKRNTISKIGLIHSIEKEDYHTSKAIDDDIIYDVKRHENNVTVTRGNFHVTMDYATFSVFIMSHEAKPYTENEISDSKKMPEEGKDEGLSFFGKLVTIGSLITSFKKIKVYYTDTFWKRRERLDSARAMVALTKRLPDGGAFYTGELKAKALNQMDSEAWQLIQEYKGNLGGLEKGESDSHAATVTKLIRNEVFDNHGTSYEFKYKSAGYLLYALEAGGPYIRKLSGHFGKGAWIKALFGESQRKAFLKNREERKKAMKAKGDPSDYEYDQSFLRAELEWIQLKSKENEHIFGSKFHRTIEKSVDNFSQSDKANEVKEGVKMKGTAKKMYKEAFVGGGIGNLIPKTMLGALLAIEESVETEADYSILYSAVVQTIATGYSTFLLDKGSRDIVKGLCRRNGIPLGLLVNDVHHLRDTYKMFDYISRQSGDERDTLTYFVQHELGNSSRTVDHITSSTFARNGNNKEIAKAINKRWHVKGKVIMSALNYENSYLLGYGSSVPPANKEEKLAIQKYITHGVFNGYKSYAGRNRVDDIDPTNPVFEHGMFNLNAGSFQSLMMNFDNNGDFVNPKALDLRNVFGDKVSTFQSILEDSGRDEKKFMIQFLLQKFFVLFGNNFDTSIEDIKNELVGGNRLSYISSGPSGTEKKGYENLFISAIQGQKRNINKRIVSTMKKYAGLFESGLSGFNRAERLAIVNNKI